jgi:hypothetical protein
MRQKRRKKGRSGATNAWARDWRRVRTHPPY